MTFGVKCCYNLLLILKIILRFKNLANFFEKHNISDLNKHYLNMRLPNKFVQKCIGG